MKHAYLSNIHTDKRFWAFWGSIFCPNTLTAKTVGSRGAVDARAPPVAKGRHHQSH